jgi:hypothetical protein
VSIQPRRPLPTRKLQRSEHHGLRNTAGAVGSTLPTTTSTVTPRTILSRGTPLNPGAPSFQPGEEANQRQDGQQQQQPTATKSSQ